MMRRLAISLCLGLCIPLAGCNFAVKHPAATAGIVGGGLGLVTCELSTQGRQLECLEISGAAAALLAGTVLIATWLGDANAEEEEPPPEPLPTEPRVGGTTPPPPGGLKPPPTTPDPAKPPPPPPIPDYLAHTTAEVYTRTGNQIVKAPPADQTVAASFAASQTRGPLKDGTRITILTARTKYQVGEEVRVIHVLDAPEPGHAVYVMGPKPITGELVDGVERTPAAAPSGTYDGRVVQSPAVDYNYEVTTYKFDAPGIHLIQWKTGGMESNVVAVEVTKP